MGKFRRSNTGQLMELVLERVGFRRTNTVLKFIALWGIAIKELGREPATMEEFAKHWEISDSQAYRYLRSFREALPEYDNPTLIVERLRDERPLLFDGRPEVVALRIGGVL